MRTKDRPDLSICKSDFECCGVEIITNTHPILALSVYRPPNTNPTNFITELSKLVHTIKKLKNTGIIIGLDHNLDFLKSSTHGPTHQFLEEIMELGLLPSITRPAKITHNTATLNDNILIDQKFSKNYKSSVLIDKISDHLPCLTTLCGITSPWNRDKTVTSQDICKKNPEKLHHKLQHTDWGFLNDYLDVNSKFNTFYQHITESIDNFCPLQERKINIKT